jgi:peroxiredoxin
MIAVGENASPFTLTRFDGGEFSLRAFNGETAVLIMFASVGCIPCEESLPAIDTALQSYGGENGLEVACIVLGNARTVKRMVGEARHEVRARLLVDRFAASRYLTAEAYGVLGTPTFFLVGRNGKVRWRHVGPVTFERLEPEIQKALRAESNGTGLVHKN